MGLQGGLIDWDGVIAKTPERQFKWFREWARQNNIEFTYDTLEEFLAVYNKIISEKSAQGVYDAFGLPCEMSNPQHPVWPAYDHFKATNPVEMYDGIEQALIDVWKLGRLNANSSRNQTMRLAINTTNSWKSIYPDLVRFGIDYLFDSYCTAETLHNFEGSGNSAALHKPSKVSVALMLHILGSEGRTTFHLGDTIGDLRASYDIRRHGGINSETLITIGAAWGFEGRAVLEKGYSANDSGTIHFTHIIDHPSELPKIIKAYR
ncbi:HAD family hydrolase [Candidatus Woesearchaeota archaeon]|nr:MAG: HAD family hydrolase [Candidatus Woesearchaeota archaeon]